MLWFRSIPRWSRQFHNHPRSRVSFPSYPMQVTRLGDCSVMTPHLISSIALRTTGSSTWGGKPRDRASGRWRHVFADKAGVVFARHAWWTAKAANGRIQSSKFAALAHHISPSRYTSCTRDFVHQQRFRVKVAQFLEGVISSGIMDLHNDDPTVSGIVRSRSRTLPFTLVRKGAPLSHLPIPMFFIAQVVFMARRTGLDHIKCNRSRPNRQAASA